MPMPIKNLHADIIKNSISGMPKNSYANELPMAPTINRQHVATALARRPIRSAIRPKNNWPIIMPTKADVLPPHHVQAAINIARARGFERLDTTLPQST